MKKKTLKHSCVTLLVKAKESAVTIYIEKLYQVSEAIHD